jgi:type II secretory pathway pseudopilin PulG
VTGRRAFSVLELMVVAGLLAILAAMIVIPAYSRYTRGRQAEDAAAELAQDISYLERYAQDSAPYEGATIEVQTNDPLTYTCYSGRPSYMDPQSYIRGVLFVRQFPDVALIPGALSRRSPLLFARNGSVQYVAANQWADQHVPVTFELVSRLDKSVTVEVGLNPFTGAASLGPQPSPSSSPTP